MNSCWSHLKNASEASQMRFLFYLPHTCPTEFFESACFCYICIRLLQELMDKVILINLIKNALQAGAKHIDISARMGKDDEVILPVANDGAPIPFSAQEQIFVPFYTTKKEGSGIGLSISRQIMRQHNGTIDLIRSDVNQTVFQLIFR